MDWKRYQGEELPLYLNEHLADAEHPELGKIKVKRNLHNQSICIYLEGKDGKEILYTASIRDIVDDFLAHLDKPEKPGKPDKPDNQESGNPRSQAKPQTAN